LVKDYVVGLMVYVCDGSHVGTICTTKICWLSLLSPNVEDGYGSSIIPCILKVYEC